jgi:hypothetical protein
MSPLIPNLYSLLENIEMFLICQDIYHLPDVFYMKKGIVTLLFLRLHRFAYPILCLHRLRQLIDQLHRLGTHRDYLRD